MREYDTDSLPKMMPPRFVAMLVGIAIILLLFAAGILPAIGSLLLPIGIIFLFTVAVIIISRWARSTFTRRT